ncbi:MAG TPA: MBL fold metallo-hydrolase [Candidatus Pacearchaeota archaeon]|nr:MBL fold metallo-hydrolase [Candidatus Pacearchaeota archaeon]HPR80012.1 MBL fold metallo-hydrolase [Candidatus Pacearchaeota archaeon]
MKQSFFILLMLLILNVLVLPFVIFFSLPAYLEVSFFNVGQGDSIFIEAPGGYQVLIDGGPSYSKVLDGLSKEMPFNDKEIDLIILSHPESDHMTGLFSVLENYKVDNIMWTGIEKDGEKFETWKRLINEEGANIYYANSGDKVIMGDAILEIINPKELLKGETFKESNNTAIVSKLLYKDSSFLFTGDISSKAENELTNIDVDVLKIPHHGSKYSTSKEFIKKVSPLVSVIQVGKNSYGHPTEEVLTRLNNFGIKILRNDTNGDIKIVSDGLNYKIITSKQ